jgi:hypothetical protein
MDKSLQTKAWVELALSFDLQRTVCNMTLNSSAKHIATKDFTHEVFNIFQSYSVQYLPNTRLKNKLQTPTPSSSKFLK